jgi:glycosyltransferase involved in cell wall biosynthesis
MTGLRIGILGGVPAPLGGGGLEVQARETGAALRRRGHEVFRIAAEEGPRAFDLLHAFGAEADVCHQLGHWRRNPSPLVVSPVLVLPPGRERVELLSARAPLASWSPAARARLLQRADLVVAQTEHEAELVARLGARKVALVPNGVIPVTASSPPLGTPEESYVALVGSISRRKRQAETVAALAGHRPVVAGGFEGTEAERRDFERVVAGAGGVWLGEISDRASLAALVAGAKALVHLSRAEGQALSLIEALSWGTPIVVSPLPANRELARTYAPHVHLVEEFADLDATLRALGPRPAAPLPVPTWDDVAATLDEHYRTLASR